MISRELSIVSKMCLVRLFVRSYALSQVLMFSTRDSVENGDKIIAIIILNGLGFRGCSI